MPPTLGLQSIQKGLDLQRMIGARLQKTYDETSRVSLWQCLDCGHSSRSKSDCSKHIEAKHIVTSGYDCSYCGSHYPSKNALKSHVSRKHRSWLANRDYNLSPDIFRISWGPRRMDKVKNDPNRGSKWRANLVLHRVQLLSQENYKR